MASLKVKEMVWRNERIMKHIWVRWLPVILGSVVVGRAIAACGGLGRNTPEAIAPSASPTEEPAVVTEDSPSPEAEPSAETPPGEVVQAPADAPALQSNLEIGQFTLQEIYDIGAAGCGMTLWNAADNSQPPGERSFLLINGLEENSMLMKIDGSVVRFQRTDFEGEAFYGQYLSQTFENSEQGIQVSADVVLGEQGEIESVSISEGMLRIEMNGAEQEFAVVGDAGC